ncbi:MAG: methyltransferase domain-containing protein [Pseudomonadota bacterium]|nr:methyltransferase domain-containing protein [Pseudomonadota bacterium]
MVQNVQPKLTNAEIKEIVKERYGKCAAAGMSAAGSCCPIGTSKNPGFATEHGLYTLDDLSLIPETALSLSRGCGNTTGFAALQPGEIVVDFGCGAGIDVILAAQKVTPRGKVIGVDSASEMIGRAKRAVAEAGFSDTVELRVADLAQTGLPQGGADVVISNCVINLCPDKEAVYREAFRILKLGGRLAISDIVYTEKIDPSVHERFQSTWSGCVGGAIDKDSYFEAIRNIGFTEIHLVAQHLLAFKELEEMACCPGPEYAPLPAEEDIAVAQDKVASIKFTAVKPHISG